MSIDRRGFIGGLVAAAAAGGIVVGDTAASPTPLTPPEPEYDIVIERTPMTYGGHALGAVYCRYTKVPRKK
ncbi:twin-arginine translocation signal domain-containing protein [Patescibacteria group bacterium]|nr:MAG: twin-arginine translocation signal domain-containing protein [Patescibacteria group bacterium]